MEPTPFRQRVERAPDWLWTADADGTVTYSNAAELPVGSRLESLGWAGVVKRGERTVDTRSVRMDDGWLGIDRDLTEAVPARVAVVRRPVVDGRREVIGYELVGDGSVLAASRRTARRAPGRSAVVAEPGRRRLAGPGRSDAADHGGHLATAAAASFEDLERIIGADLGLSLALLRHVNSA